jgi:preprotein translocase subunit SecB
MADNAPEQGAAGEGAVGQQATENRAFSIRKIYTRDISFENPNAPQIFSEEKWTPEVSINLTNQVAKVADNLHEVALGVTVTAKIGDKTAYLVEVQQAGEFQTTGFEGKELRELLGVYCPGLLFPYLREAVSTLTARGGFPPLHLAPVNFEALYVQHMKNLQEQQAQATN